MKNIMTSSEMGFTLIGVIIGIAIMSLVTVGASKTIIQVINLVPSVDSKITVKNQIQNAEYWITNDAQMARTITTQGLPTNDFIVLNWVEYSKTGDVIDHTVTYYFEELEAGNGILKRHYLSSTGEDKDTVIAEYICYDPGDPDNTSLASYQDGIFNVRLAGACGDDRVTRILSITPCKINLG